MSTARTLTRLAVQAARSDRPLVYPRRLSPLQEREYRLAYLGELWRRRVGALKGGRNV